MEAAWLLSHPPVSSPCFGHGITYPCDASTWGITSPCTGSTAIHVPVYWQGILARPCLLPTIGPCISHPRPLLPRTSPVPVSMHRRGEAALSSLSSLSSLSLPLWLANVVRYGCLLYSPPCLLCLPVLSASLCSLLLCLALLAGCACSWNMVARTPLPMSPPKSLDTGEEQRSMGPEHKSHGGSFPAHHERRLVSCPRALGQPCPSGPGVGPGPRHQGTRQGHESLGQEGRAGPPPRQRSRPESGRASGLLLSTAAVGKQGAGLGQACATGPPLLLHPCLDPCLDTWRPMPRHMPRHA